MKKFNKQLLGGISAAFFAFVMSASAYASVSIKVTGDTDHAPYKHTAYQTWLETSLDFEEGQKADRYMQAALDGAKMPYEYSSGYLSSVTSAKGVKLPGKSNVGYGGWMFSVNGTSPAVGLADYEIKDSDEIEIYYTDDYREIYGYGLNLNVNVEDAAVKIIDSSGTETADSGWGYSLFPGEYTYTAEKAGYYTKTGSFAVTNDDVTLDIDLVKENSSLVKVIGDSVHGAEAHTAAEGWISAQAEASGSQTAAEVLFAALDGAGYKYDWNEEYGYIASVTTPEGSTLGEYSNGPYSGWMFFVNGAETGTGLTGYTVKSGDIVEFRYVDDYRTLYGYSLNVAANVEGAVVKIFDSTGAEVVDYGWGYSVFPGEYTYTAEKEGYVTESGSFTVGDGDYTLDITLVSSTGALVSIIGDSVHEIGAHSAYKNWISEQLEAADGTTADKLILAALDKAGYKYNYSNGYLSSITTPEGVELGGGTNGAYSGWMFEVNGVLPTVGISEYTVKAGDRITFFYLDDYRKLYGYGLVINKNAEDIAVSIYDSEGNEMLDSGWGYSLPAGSYTYVASQERSGRIVYGSFEVTDDDAVINIELEPGYLWGDYDLNGKLDSADAASILQKALVSTFPAALENTVYIDVDLNGDITANDAAVVLSKVLNSAYKMPCEKE